jgi:hypothetical protein
MPSSTSSSDGRPLPDRSLGIGAAIALILMLVLLGGWEAYWRDLGSVPSYRNSDGLWAIQRRRIDNGEGDKTILTGSSRVFFDTQLDVWERESGERPIQLALEGTTPVPVMEDLAEDPDFTGTLIVGVSPNMMFTGFAYRESAFKHYHEESPSQWLGQQISMLVEPYLAFYHFDYSLFTVIKRQPLPKRDITFVFPDVRRLATYEKDRATRLWSKVETDEAYAQRAKEIWAAGFIPIEERDQEWLEQAIKDRDTEIEKAVAATKRLQARGVEVIFVRFPSGGHYAISEPMYAPRAENWDVLIEKTGALGVHWEDHQELQGYWMPEWSHMSGTEADRFTKAVYDVIQRERLKRDKSNGA